MAVRTTPAWFSLGRILAFVALILVVLTMVIPGVPEWLLGIAVILLAIALLIG